MSGRATRTRAGFACTLPRAGPSPARRRCGSTARGRTPRHARPRPLRSPGDTSRSRHRSQSMPPSGVCFPTASAAVDVEVERAARRVAGEPVRLVEDRDAEIAPPLEHRDVVLDERLVTRERLDSGPLADARRPARGLRLDLRHRRDELLRPRPVADAPSGHAVGLREPVHRQGAPVQVGRDLRHRRKRLVAVDDVLVDVVGEHPHVRMPAQHLGEPFQILRRVERAGRVARVVEDQPLRLRGDRVPRAARASTGTRSRLSVATTTGVPPASSTMSG